MRIDGVEVFPSQLMMGFKRLITAAIKLTIKLKLLQLQHAAVQMLCTFAGCVL